MALLYDTSTTAITEATWYAWCDGTNSTSIALTTAKIIWIRWNTAATNVASTAYTTNGCTTIQDSRTAEQRAADDARYAEQLRIEQVRRTEAATRATLASAKARALLLSMLEVHQREQLQRDQYFEVIARHSKRRYRIRQGTHGNVRLLDAHGREVTRYCGQPPGVPTEDCMLAQKLQIEHDEEAFLRAANASRVA